MRYYQILRYNLPLHLVLLSTNWLPDNVFFLRLRGFLASFFFKKCGSNLRLGRNISFYSPYNIVLGRDVYVAYGTWFLGASEIVIKDEVLIGPYCVFADANHTLLNGSYRYGNPVNGPICVGEGSWIGAHSTVLMNVNIGKGSLVAANSVVNKNVDEFKIVGGVPIRELKK